MKKFRNIFLIFFVCLSTVVFSACSFDFFDFYEDNSISNLDKTTYVEVVNSKIISSENNEEAQENSDYIATSDELDENQTLSKLISTREKIRSFNVYIETELYDTSYYFFTRTSDTINLGSGSIIYIDETTKIVYVLTNYHVVTKQESKTNHTYDYANYTVQTLSGNKYTASLVSYNKTDDMAILSFYNSNNEQLGVANLSARSDGKMYKDEFLLAVGNPSGVRNIVTYGKFLGTSNISNVNYQVIHHSVIINPGNSGGALTDLDGNVVGVNTWGTDGDDEDNYSIPLKKVILFIQQTQQNLQSFPEIA